MNAIQLLKEDHRRVRELFSEVGPIEDPTERKKIFEEIHQELDLHSFVEETIFYPMFTDNEELVDLIEDAYDDHQEIADLLDEMETLPPGDLDWANCLDELIENVNDHISREERELFSAAERILSSEDLDRIGEQIEESKRSTPQAA